MLSAIPFVLRSLSLHIAPQFLNQTQVPDVSNIISLNECYGGSKRVPRGPNRGITVLLTPRRPVSIKSPGEHREIYFLKFHLDFNNKTHNV